MSKTNDGGLRMIIKYFWFINIIMWIALFTEMWTLWLFAGAGQVIILGFDLILFRKGYY